jgi:predicted NodU family carbamoyl transferase
MLVLGWHGSGNFLEGDSVSKGNYHDAAAVILNDGAIVAAIEK